jgi:Ser/Thr protein kinase RdoA (MazF antagonist)
MAPEGERFAVLFNYAPGVALDYAAEADDSYRYGQAAARLHRASDSFRSQWPRANLDFDQLMHAPLRVIEPLLAHRPRDWEYLLAIATRITSAFEALLAWELSWGFCHGDLHGWNAHRAPDQTLTFFDFDCCGFGWRAYDLAPFRRAARMLGREQQRWPAFLRGYQSVRGLSDSEILATGYLMAVRHFWILGLHAGKAPIWGYATLNDAYFDQALAFLRSWEQDFLTTAPTVGGGSGASPSL